MKNYLYFLFSLLLLMGCNQPKEPLPGKSKFQKELNAEFKDASKSPLKKKDRRNFKELDFFEIDSAFMVEARLERTEAEEPFKMKTTTGRLPEYKKFGQIHFVLQGQDYVLNVYQNLDLIGQEEFKDHLFLPFLDDTNGDETYGGGRYIDLRIPSGEKIKVDFNTAYNPYCAYNETFSCPIVPQENYLATEVRAGVKAYRPEEN